MIITKRHISRRTVLRGMGVTMALPFLDAMVPARTLQAKTAAAGKVRLSCIEQVHGAAGSTKIGLEKNMWSPAEVGRAFDLSPTSLSPLEPYRNHITIVSNTDVRNAEAFAPNEIGGDHFRSSAVFLTQSHPKQTQGSDLYVGTSLDQLVARRIAGDTAIPSMQLCIENLDQAGGCYYNYGCAYTDTISWASPSQPLPMIRDPRIAFDLLFGAGGTNAERASRRQTNQSILDWIVGEVSTLKRDLGASDRQRVDQYLENIRELERRIDRIVARNTSGEARELPEAPAGVPDSFEEHMKLMFDFQVLAFEADMTRVFSFKTGRDASNRSYPESGTSSGFHPASHHGGRDTGVMNFNLINKYHVSLLPYFLEKLKNTTEAEGNLLDKTMIIYGSPMADSNLHSHRRCPLILLGGGNGTLQGDLHLKAPDGTPMANVMLTLMHKLGMDDMPTFGDSTDVFPLGPTSVTAAANG